ncbi:hypothetical protein KY285_033081 [Solanum tuberosum]|nr:hypothetical protein KY285_033081 [Solanum tuberosum]
MANLTKLEFISLHSSGKNYLSWVLDGEIHLDAMGLGDTIKEENKASKQNCARAMIFLRHHLDEILKIEYLTLKLCGETVSEIDMMEKAFSTFHASNVLLQQQYREKVNEAYAHHARRGKGRGPNRGRDYGQERNSFPGVNHLSNKNHNQKEKRKDEKREATREGCFQCGGRGHYARDCSTHKHLVELYKKSLKKKEKNPEANFVSENQVDITHLDVADFFTHPEGKIDHIIGDGSVNMEE